MREYLEFLEQLVRAESAATPLERTAEVVERFPRERSYDFDWTHRLF